MRVTGVYCPQDKEGYDVDHEISDRVKALELLVKEIDNGENYKNDKLIIRALIDTLLDKL